ncbi:hypothetical protein OIV83_003660 [Microbotryomycetes sp. JL201]|nr:hypothetical protein OIV83_003660 [Microbotryomycetes sp. JL201]
MLRWMTMRLLLGMIAFAVLASALPTSHHRSHVAVGHLERRQDPRPSIIINTRGDRDRAREQETSASNTDRRARETSSTRELSSSTRAVRASTSSVVASTFSTTSATQEALLAPFSSSITSTTKSTSSAAQESRSSSPTSHLASSKVTAKSAETSAATSAETSNAQKSFLQPGNKYFPLAVILFIAAVIFAIKCCCHTRRFADPRDYPFSFTDKPRTESTDNLIPSSPSSSIEEVLDEKEYLPWHAVDQGMRMQPPADDDTPLAILAPRVRRCSAPNMTPTFVLPPAPAMISSPVSHHPALPLDSRILFPAPQAVAMSPRRSSLPSQLMPRAGTPPPPSVIMARPRSFSHPAPPPVPQKAVAPPPRQGLTPSERARLGSYHLKYQPARPSSLRYSVHSDESDGEDLDDKASIETPEPVAGPSVLQRAKRMGVARVRILG